MLDGHNHISCMSCISCHTSPKEEIINDWESEVDIIFNTDMTKVDIKHLIKEAISSTEKRVAMDIVGEIEKYEKKTLELLEYSEIKRLPNTNEIKDRLEEIETIINLIKSKYE